MNGHLSGKRTAIRVNLRCWQRGGGLDNYATVSRLAVVIAVTVGAGGDVMRARRKGDGTAVNCAGIEERRCSSVGAVADGGARRDGGDGHLMGLLVSACARADGGCGNARRGGGV